MNSVRWKRIGSGFLLGCALVLIVTQPAWSATLSGKWTGTVAVHDPASGNDLSTEVELRFDEPRSGAVSGTIGRQGDAEPVSIRNGALSGRQVSFEAASPETSGPMRFTLLLEGDQLTGEMHGAIDSGEIAGTVKLTRETR